MSEIPGYKSMKEFATANDIKYSTVKCHMLKGFCRFPRITQTGKSSDPAYSCWSSMIQRATNPNLKCAKYYEHVDIELEWKNSFQAFIEHIGPRPSKKHSIDRIDVYKGYVKGNVRWATQSQQVLNNTRKRKGHIKKMATCYQAFVSKNGKSHHLGSFISKEEAQKNIDLYYFNREQLEEGGED